MMLVVTGLCADLSAAERVLCRLVEVGFDREAVSVITHHTPEHEKLLVAETDETQRGLLAGALTGGVLASLAFAALTLPGVGVIAAGPMVTALTAGAAGAAAGGLIGALEGHGLSRHVAQQYEEALHQGRVLVAVHCADRGAAHRAKEVLAAVGADHVSDALQVEHRHGTAEE